MIGIYRITNPNGKEYIGSSINIERRWATYKRLNCKTQRHLFASLNKYGVENHIFEVIWEVNNEQLLEVEQFLINTLKPELNISKIAGRPASRLGLKHSEETRAKISKSKDQGLDSRSKEYQSKYRKEYQSEYQKEYYLRKQEQIKEYRQTNKDKMNEYQKEYRIKKKLIVD